MCKRVGVVGGMCVVGVRMDDERNEKEEEKDRGRAGAGGHLFL